MACFVRRDLRAAALRAGLVAIPFAGAALAADEAHACFPDACFYAESWSSLTPLNAAAIPTDGVLLLQGGRTDVPVDSVPFEDLLADLTVTVTRDGEPVAGSLEQTEISRVVAWRPAAPLMAGATYVVTGAIDNPDGFTPCGPDLLEIEFEFHVDDGPAVALVPPQVSASESVRTTSVTRLETLACCDDAYPAEYTDDCGGPTGIRWDAGQCTPTRAYGRLDVALTVQHGLPPGTAGQLVRSIVGERTTPGEFTDELTVTGGGPFCAQVKLRNLATGETVMSAEQCHGEAVAGQLGELELDPHDALAGQCEGPLYVCEPAFVTMFETRWDVNACRPVVDEGCDCSSRAGPAPWWLALALLGLRRRRAQASVS